MFGAADYAADLGQQVGVFQPDFARASLVNAAAPDGVGVLDGKMIDVAMVRWARRVV
jgi:(S)-citramalyl-CoA lyase